VYDGEGTYASDPVESLCDGRWTSMGLALGYGHFPGEIASILKRAIPR
jgi:hypothetical protein